jgi:hypothetical protein
MAQLRLPGTLKGSNGSALMRHIICLQSAGSSQAWKEKLELDPTHPVGLLSGALGRADTHISAAEPYNAAASLFLQSYAATFTCLVYPNRIVARADTLEALVDRVSRGEGDVLAAHDVLVCIHGARDERCGQQGPKLLECFSKDSSADVRLWASSHITGHRFAPICAVYPNGDFYGSVSTSSCSCQSFLHASTGAQTAKEVLQAGELKGSWRGRLCMTPERQIELADQINPPSPQK